MKKALSKLKRLSASLILLFVISCSSDSDSTTQNQITINVEDLEVSVDENPEENQILGQVSVTTNASEVSFSLGNVNPEGALKIDVGTGEISVLDETLFDFEEYSTISASIIVEAEGVSSTANLVVNIIDISLSNFTEIESSGSIFSGRTGMKAIEFNGKLFLIGGWDGGQSREVWSTENGEDWELVGSFGTIETSGLYVQAVVFNDALWVYTAGGGVYPSEIWTSVDGVTWVEETSDEMFTLSQMNIFIFNDKLWAIGGTPAEESGVWSSTNGLDWIKETISGADFAGLTSFEVVVFNNQIFVLGGYISGVGSSNDVWSSQDGLTWSEVTSEGLKFNSETGHQAVVFDNKIWILGGIADEYLNEVWYSTDGSEWQQQIFELEVFSDRAYHASVVFDSSIWVIGGRFNSEPRLNDIWKSN